MVKMIDKPKATLKQCNRKEKKRPIRVKAITVSRQEEETVEVTLRIESTDIQRILKYVLDEITRQGGIDA